MELSKTLTVPDKYKKSKSKACFIYRQPVWWTVLQMFESAPLCKGSCHEVTEGLPLPISKTRI